MSQLHESGVALQAADPAEILRIWEDICQKVQLQQQAEQAKLDEAEAQAKEQARLAALKAEEEERRQKARQERDQERNAYMAKIAAEKEEAKQREQA